MEVIDLTNDEDNAPHLSPGGTGPVEQQAPWRRFERLTGTAPLAFVVAAEPKAPPSDVPADRVVVERKQVTQGATAAEIYRSVVSTGKRPVEFISLDSDDEEEERVDSTTITMHEGHRHGLDSDTHSHDADQKKDEKQKTTKRPADDIPTNKIRSGNLGYSLLEKAGWKPGTGLGLNGDGRTDPVLPKYKNDRRGLGVPPLKPPKSLTTVPEPRDVQHKEARRKGGRLKVSEDGEGQKWRRFLAYLNS
ncbi:hypothetical protein HKX48_003488 [Thoreauomyces humboldtii]|nr:hypothetical protein HKX48_003488 [Thoreauomyces humboldtii]